MFHFQDDKGWVSFVPLAIMLGKRLCAVSCALLLKLALTYCLPLTAMVILPSISAHMAVSSMLPIQCCSIDSIVRGLETRLINTN